MIEIEAHLADNYRQLKKERDLTWEQLAQRVATTDRRVAAWMREQADAEKGRVRGRRTRQPSPPDATATVPPVSDPLLQQGI